MSAPAASPRLLRTTPPEWVVSDAPSPCPYLDGQVARLPMRVPLRALKRAELDVRLVAGDRRQGLLLYSPACPRCNACEPIRLPVDRFRYNRTQRRVLARGRERVRVEVGRCDATPEKVALYNRHKQARGLAAGARAIGLEDYRAFLGTSCCESFELRYSVDDRLVGVAVTDRSSQGLSAVYCYFEPALARLSLGVFSILQQIELCRAWGLPYLYLGLYVEGCDAMAYKGRYVPHERRLGDRWVPHDRACR